MPYWRLSGFYFFYFASLGALLPYWSLYLKAEGYTVTAIGNIMAILMATKIVAPNVWGWIADHTGRRMAIVRTGCLLAALSFAAVFRAEGFWLLALVMMVFSFFWNAALPQFEATTFHHLGGQTHRYSSVRLWGSIGFILTAWGLGELMNGEGVRLLPWILMSLFVAIWVSSLLVPEEAAGHQPLDHEPLRRILARPHVAGLLVVCFLMQASHGPYYTFYTIYMESYGYSLGLIGGLWALGVIAEVGIFLIMPRLEPAFGLRNLLLASLFLAMLRWILIALFPTWLPLMLLAQTLHAASFGIYHAAAIHLIHRYFGARHQGKGQALYSSLSFGAGGALGSFASGQIYSGMGPQLMFLGAAALCLLGGVIAWYSIPRRSASA